LRFSAVYRVGGAKSLPLFAPETGGGSRAKKFRFKRAGIFTAGCIGTIEGANPSFGDVLAALRKKALIVPPGLLMRQHYKRQ